MMKLSFRDSMFIFLFLAVCSASNDINSKEFDTMEPDSNGMINFGTLAAMDLLESSFASLSRIPSRDFMVTLSPLSECSTVIVKFIDAASVSHGAINSKTMKVESELTYNPYKREITFNKKSHPWDRSFINFKVTEKDVLFTTNTFTGKYTDDVGKPLVDVKLSGNLLQTSVLVLTNSRYCHARVSSPGVNSYFSYPDTVNENATVHYTYLAKKKIVERAPLAPRMFNPATGGKAQPSKLRCLPFYHVSHFANLIPDEEWGTDETKVVINTYSISKKSHNGKRSLNLVYRSCEHVTLLFKGPSVQDKMIDLVLGYNFFVPPMTNEAVEFSYNMKELSNLRIYWGVTKDIKNLAALGYFSAGREAMAFKNSFDFGEDIGKYNSVLLIRSPGCQAALLDDQHVGTAQKQELMLDDCSISVVDYE